MNKILFLGRFFPVVHGASVMNESYYDELSKDKEIKIRKIRINYSSNLDELGKVNLEKFMGIIIVFFQTLYNLLFFRPNVIYFELAIKGFAFYRDSIYLLTCKIFKKRVIIHIHGKGIINNFYSRFLFKNTKIVLLSELLYDELKKFIPKENVVFISNGLEDNLRNTSFDEIINKRNKNKKVNLLYLSNMIKSKGVLDVLRVCNELNKENIDFKCDFIGSFQDIEFKKVFENKLKEFNLEKKCNYLGKKYGEDKFEVLEKTNYLIFPTKYPLEAFPLVILEAFMYGVPVLSYDNGAIKEIICKEELGFVGKGSPIELYSGLVKRIREKKEEPNKVRNEFIQKYRINFPTRKLKEVLKHEF